MERAVGGPRLVDSLAKAARRHPLERKLVVAPEQGVGRELLRALARSGRGWVGFEITTPRPLALRVCDHRLRNAGLRAVDAFDQQALLDEALDGEIAAGTWRTFSELSEGVGFRERVHGAVAALRLAGVDARTLTEASLRDRRKQRFLAGVLGRYEALLAERKAADTATVYAEALAELAGARSLESLTGAEVVLLVPGLGTRGLAGKLLSALRALGAGVLETDPVVGLEAPASVLWAAGAPSSALSCLHDPVAASGALSAASIEVFHAASPTAELREVARRVQERGLCWDQVEIVAVDPAAYGSALHALGTRLGIPVTYAVGLPLERTRTGRVAAAYLEWLEGGFQADVIRRLLESGDLRPSGGDEAPPPAELARRFRSLRIGWGRERYERQLADALDAVDRMQPMRRESPTAFGWRRGRARAELEALASILRPTLRATPVVAEGVGDRVRPVSPAELAAGLRTFLACAPGEEGPDRVARERVDIVLQRVAATLHRPTDFPAALTILRRHLAVRVPAPDPSADPDESGAPWTSEGGHLHLSDLEHGGYAGREAVFVVGADADRLPGGETQDPLLLDHDRGTLGDLPLSRELLAERIFRFAAFFARLGGSICLSYSAWDSSDGRTIAPSAALLQALRLARADEALTFDDLRRALGAVVSVVPAPERSWLDGDDVWMAAIEHRGLMRDAGQAVRAAFAGLHRGVAARDQRRTGVPGPFHGVVAPRPDFDPRRNSEIVVSASRLEALGSCPLRYLHEVVLRVRPPDDFEYDPDAWLDPLRRGDLLHTVYERSLRLARDRDIAFEDRAFEELVMDEVAQAVRRAKVEVPAPGEGVVRREVAGLEEDGRSFVRMVRQRGAPWVALEMRFGLGDDEPLVLSVPGGEIRVRGAVDRIDERNGALHVVDYKTGLVWGYDEGKGSFSGGRRLQHALYASAAEARLGRTVGAGEYHFPTTRGENEVRAYDRLALAAVSDLLGHMLDGVAEGAFVPTEEEGDCRFCDEREVCRARQLDYGKVDSPMARWSKEQMAAGIWPAMGRLRQARRFEE